MNYESMDSLELQRVSLECASHLRRLEADMHGEQAPQPWATSDQDRYTAIHAKYVAIFQGELKSHTTFIYEELLRRSGEPKRSLAALEFGILAGANPLEECAREIERLVRQIPLRPN